MELVALVILLAVVLIEVDELVVREAADGTKPNVLPSLHGAWLWRPSSVALFGRD